MSQATLYIHVDKHLADLFLGSGGQEDHEHGLQRQRDDRRIHARGSPYGPAGYGSLFILFLHAGEDHAHAHAHLSLPPAGNHPNVNKFMGACLGVRRFHSSASCWGILS